MFYDIEKIKTTPSKREEGRLFYDFSNKKPVKKFSGKHNRADSATTDD